MQLTCSHNAFTGSSKEFNQLRLIALECTVILLSNHKTGFDLFYDLSYKSGNLTPKQCLLVKEALTHLMPSIKATAQPNQVKKLQQFIDGCKLAAQRNENLTFE